MSLGWHNSNAIAIEQLDGRNISFANIDSLSAQFANVLIAEGVKPGDRVACRADKSPDVILLYLACLRAGAVFLPLNPTYTLHEIEFTLNDAEPKILIAPPNEQHQLSELCSNLGIASCFTLGTNHDGTFVKRALEQPNYFRDFPTCKEDLAAILYTSGTTGRPKGAMLTHENLYSNASALKEAWRFTENDTLIHALPVFHAHGLFVACNVCLLARARMLFLRKFTNDGVFKALPRATAMMGVPTFYTRLLNDPRFNKDNTDHMRLFVSGSAPLLANTHREFKTRTGHEILERYGLTETGMNTSNPYDGKRKPGSVGQPLPGVDVRVTDPATGDHLANGEIGMIEVKGPNVFKGYWRLPDKTAADFRSDGFFITGDLGQMEDDGYIYIADRAKDLIISGGLNVYPKEVETTINEIPEIRECAVIGLKDDDLGESVTAIVVASEKNKPDKTAIQRRLDEKLARYKHPKRIIFANELPRNAMGKVQRNVLRKLYETSTK